MNERLSMQAWEELDAVNPAPTFFARPAWAKALCATYSSMSPAALRVRVDGERLVLPAVETRGRFAGWRQLVALPLGTYTCVLNEEGGTVRSAVARSAIEAVAARFDSSEFNLWPMAQSEIPCGNWRSVPHEAAVIDLSGGRDAVLANLDGVSRRMAGQAARRGVTCAPLRDPAAVDAYFAILEEAAALWGLAAPPYPKQLLQALHAYGGRDVEFWLACSESSPIAGAVALYGSAECFIWTAAMRRSHGRLRPSNALNVAMLSAACDRGIRWYNLGSSEGLPGVRNFKRDLGATEVSYHALFRERSLYTLYTRLRAPLAARAIGVHR